MTGPRLLLAITFAIAAMCAGIVVATTDAHAVVRWTARSSLLLFSLAYVARPATQLWPGRATKRLLAERKWIGDGFAVSHLAHLAGIVAIAIEDWDRFLAARTPATLFALVVFAVLFAMAITSIDAIRRAMSRRAWTTLHRSGMHMAWLVFAASYVGRLKLSPIWAGPVALLGVIAAIRAAAWRRGITRARGKARARASVAAWPRRRCRSTRSW